MVSYKQDKRGRQGKIYRAKLRKDALKDVPKVEKEPPNPEDVKRILEMWQNSKKKNDKRN